jgi:signal transduction histidine kinase
LPTSIWRDFENDELEVKMDLGEKPVIEIESIPLRDVAEALHRTRPFASVDFDALPEIERVERVVVPEGGVLIESNQPWSYYWVVLQGETRAEKPEPDGTWTLGGMAHTGEGFGEAPFLLGRTTSMFRVSAAQDSVLIRFTEQEFWSLLACCLPARSVILADVAQRFQSYQVEALHREKLVSLGTLAAGLMHELHNPGSAAKRAASQLRENLLRLQQLSLRHAEHPKTVPQMECIRGLLEHAMNGCSLAAMSTLDQSDAEEAMGEWLTKSGVENAYTIAPTLVGMGFDQDQLSCARDLFDPPGFSDALNWLGSLVASVSLVCAIEESIARISELVMAVKKFAYDERSAARQLDVHDSLQSTLTILGHKLRLKQISIDKRFAASPSVIQTRGSALSQVWTNLIDNAVDASSDGGQIAIETWNEPAAGDASGWLAVSIADRGSGIPPDVLPHIFEAFFTTKTQGSGTGLGLEIVHRIVTQKFGGTIEVVSEPGNTRFIVRLPVNGATESKP